MKKLEFVIDRKGNIKQVAATGFGSKCLEATSNLERRLGVVDESSRQMTEEFNEVSTENTTSQS